MNNNVTLVDLFGNKLGEMEKLEAHRKGKLHYAFSLFIIKDGKMLLQKRAKEKYHSGGLWSNACCSHPQMYENIFKNLSSKGINNNEISLLIFSPNQVTGIRNSRAIHTTLGGQTENIH